MSPQKCLMSQFLKLVNIILNGIKKERKRNGGRERGTKKRRKEWRKKGREEKKHR